MYYLICIIEQFCTETKKKHIKHNNKFIKYLKINYVSI